MIYKRNKINRIDIKKLPKAIIPLCLLILMYPIIRESLSVLEMVLKIMFRVN